MAEVSETAASLRIIGDDLEPAHITELLGKQPSLAHAKGEDVPLKNGRGFRSARIGMWRFSVGRKKPGDLDDQILEILEGTTNDLSIWNQLSKRYRVEIFCGIFLMRTNEGLGISAVTVQMLGSRGIELDFDIYYAD